MFSLSCRNLSIFNNTWIWTKLINFFLFCSNANSLHYYALQVPRRADRWRWVWSIFKSRTTWADHITCGTSICIVYWRKLRLERLCVVECGMMIKRGDKVKPGDAHSLLLSKSTKGPPDLTSPSDERIAINGTICLLNIHTAEGFGI